MSRYLHYIGLSLSLFLVSCSGESEKESPDTTETTTDSLLSTSLKEHSNIMSSWAAQNDLVLTDNFESSNTGTVALMPRKTALIDSFYELYGKLLVYNNDSSKFIDFASYPVIIEKNDGELIARAGGPDQEISFTNLKTDTTTRCFFLGTCCRVQDAFWYNDDIIGLMGMAETEEEGNYEAVIWFINIKTSQLISYELGKTMKANDANDFLLKSISKKGVQVAE